MRRCSVIVDYFHFICIVIAPHEADAILIVNADAVLARSIPSQFLKAIAGRLLKIQQFSGGVQDREFPPGDTRRRRSPGPASPPNLFGRSIRESTNHTVSHDNGMRY